MSRYLRREIVRCGYTGVLDDYIAIIIIEQSKYLNRHSRQLTGTQKFCIWQIRVSLVVTNDRAIRWKLRGSLGACGTRCRRIAMQIASRLVKARPRKRFTVSAGNWPNNRVNKQGFDTFSMPLKHDRPKIKTIKECRTYGENLARAACYHIIFCYFEITFVVRCLSSGLIWLALACRVYETALNALKFCKQYNILCEISSQNNTYINT